MAACLKSDGPDKLVLGSLPLALMHWDDQVLLDTLHAHALKPIQNAWYDMM